MPELTDSSVPRGPLYETYVFIKGEHFSEPEETMNNTAAFWRGDGYVVRIWSDERQYRMHVYEAYQEPQVRGEKRYGACLPSAEGSGYFGFGGHVVRRNDSYHIYCIGTEDADWQYFRLQSGLQAMSHNQYYAPEQVEEYMRPLYGSTIENSRIMEDEEVA